MQQGISGKIANFFINSKLTILLMVALMIIGSYSSFLIPREEEPQINVPMADVMVMYPGASPSEVESRVVKPLEKIIGNIKGVEHIHSMAMNGYSMMVVQFYVGQNSEDSYVKLYDELMKHRTMFPEGVMQPIVKTRAIDDVPMLGLTLWSEKYDDFQLRQIAEEVTSEVEKVKDVAITKEIGGRTRELKVILDKDKMAENGVDALSIMQMIQANNGSSQSGSFVQNDTEYLVTTGKFLANSEDVENLVVGVNSNMPVYLKQVASIQDGPQTPKNYVSFGYGKANDKFSKFNSEYPAVTISVAKVKGADAMQISEKILDKIESLKKSIIPNDVHVEISRNYGETASHKVGELLMHLGVAILAVTILVMLAMGWRGGLVVFFSVPLTFALTLFSYYLLGYTLNRITLFALVFVVGIVVDDSIIIAENMHRHFKMKQLPFKQAAIYAINEVGNPTILATFTVIAAILPMAFVSGMMGPYMSPMPIGASIAMLLSLFVALTVTPYLGYHLLHEKDEQEVKQLGLSAIDMVVCNLYPFLETAKKNPSTSELIEMIDIGGPTMIRAAAKNHRDVAVVVEPADARGQQLDAGLPTQRRQQLVLQPLRAALDVMPHGLQHQLDHVQIALDPVEPTVEQRQHAPVLGLHLADAGDGLAQAVELGLDPFPGGLHPLVAVADHPLLRPRSP